jgi:hypothetical protein
MPKSIGTCYVQSLKKLGYLFYLFFVTQTKFRQKAYFSPSFQNQGIYEFLGTPIWNNC